MNETTVFKAIFQAESLIENKTLHHIFLSVYSKNLSFPTG